MLNGITEAKKQLKAAGFKQGKTKDMTTYVTLHYTGLMYNGCELNLYISYNDTAVRTEGVVLQPSGTSTIVYDINGIQGLYSVIEDSRKRILTRGA